MTGSQDLFDGWARSEDAASRYLAVRWLARDPERAESSRLGWFALEDPDREVRETACTALVQQRGREAYQAFVAALNARGPRDDAAREAATAILLAGGTTMDLPPAFRGPAARAATAAIVATSTQRVSAETRAWKRMLPGIVAGVAVAVVAYGLSEWLIRELVFYVQTSNPQLLAGICCIAGIVVSIFTSRRLSRSATERLRFIAGIRRWLLVLDVWVAGVWIISVVGVTTLITTEHTYAYYLKSPWGADARACAATLGALFVGTALLAIALAHVRVVKRAALFFASLAAFGLVPLVLHVALLFDADVRRLILLTLCMLPFALPLPAAAIATVFHGSTNPAARDRRAIGMLGAFIACGIVAIPPWIEAGVFHLYPLAFDWHDHPQDDAGFRPHTLWVDFVGDGRPRTFVHAQQERIALEGHNIVPVVIFSRFEFDSCEALPEAESRVGCSMVEMTSSGNVWRATFDRPQPTEGVARLKILVGSRGEPYKLDWRNTAERLHAEMTDADERPELERPPEVSGWHAVVEVSDRRSEHHPLFVLFKATWRRKIEPPPNPVTVRNVTCIELADHRCHLSEGP